MDPSICPACGQWSDDLAVTEPDPALVCPACGHRRPFTRLPLFALTGPSGAGKSTVAAVLAGHLRQVVILDQDLLWLPDQLDPANDHRQFRRLWLRLAAALHQNGRPVLLCGTVVPGQFEACPEQRLIGDVHYLALTCDDPELRSRLAARPPWRAWTDDKITEMLAFNQWIRRNAATTTPRMHLLDTTSQPPKDTAAQVQAWVLNLLTPAP